jgi:hypothetical protein
MRQLLLSAMSIVIVILCVAGCVKMDQDVTLKADGSSAVKIHYAMREEHVAQMQATQGMPGMGMPGAPGAPGAPDPAKMQAMLKQIEEMQKRAGTTPGGSPAMPFDMKKLAEQMEAMRRGAKPPAKGTGVPGLPGTTTPSKPKPEKSIKEQIEDMKKAGRKDPALSVKKPDPGASSDELRKEIEKMKAAARKEAAIGKGEQLKPEVPRVERPTKLKRPPSALPATGKAGFGGLLFNEKAIRKQFAARKKDGVELKDVKVITKDGWRHVYITSTCKDLSTGGDKGSSMGLSKDADGNYVLVIAHPQFGKMSGSGTSAEEQKAELARARKSMPGFKMTMNLTVPGAIVKTNAHKTSGRTVNWVLDIDDAKFPQKCRALDREGMKVVFKSAGLDLKTFKPTVIK